MDNYDELYRKLIDASLNKNLQSEVDKIKNTQGEGVNSDIQTILHPEQNPLIVQLKKCSCSGNEKKPCEVACLFDAIKRGDDGKLAITSDCTGCGRCIDFCKEKVLTGRKDAIPLLELLQNKEIPIYAMIAPAFSGQFSSEVTSGKLRSAFKSLGFYGMIEVALFADILTLKEALEFDRSINNDNDFLLTSCCCPMWMALIKKSYSSLIPHIPPSVSPMVACGRSIKKIHPEAKTVFIGPCIAKKAESRESDIADAVDFVLTFDEVFELFNAMELNLSELPEDMSDHSSRSGRIYARTGGVSEAVQQTLNRLRPDKKIALIAKQADGIIACKNLLKEISEGNIQANFIEGMGCKGGCVGGPKSLIDKEKATEYVNEYGNETDIKTPVDNTYVLEMLDKLGFDSIESLLYNDSTFTRRF